MQGLSSPQGPGTWRLRRWIAITVAAVVVVSALLLSPLPPEVTRWISGSALVSCAGLLTTLFLRRRRRASGRRRWAWTCFTVCAALGLAANLLLLLRGSVADEVGPSDILLAAALVSALLGMLLFPMVRRRSTDLARMILDGVVIGGSVLFMAHVTVFPQLLVGGEHTPGSLVVPVVDMMVATVAAMLTLRGASGERTVFGLTSLGFVAMSISDLGYVAVVSQTGAFAFGSPIDIGWITGYLLIALAAHRSATGAGTPGARPAEASPVPGTVVMFLLFVGAAAISLDALGKGSLSRSAAVMWLVVLVAVLARQVMLVVDNDRLRRSLSRSLRQVAQQSDLLVNSVGDGIYGVDRVGMITFVNPAASRALGLPAHELIGRDAHQAFHAEAPDGTPFHPGGCYITEAVRDRAVTSSEEDHYVRSDGFTIPVEVTASPLIIDSTAVGAVVVFRDVTQRHEVDRLKSEFVSMVSHELRTPLTAIRGSLGLLAGGALGQLTPAAMRMTDIAVVSCERLTRLIDDILDIERVESGVLAFEVSEHPARRLVEAATGQVQVLAAEAAITVVADRLEGEVLTDADRVVQTLLNLIGNAIKFSEAGQQVEIFSRSHGAFVEFAVRDSGRGVPPDQLDSIFTRFHQVDSSDAREKGGSGLGLAISRSIVEKLGGRIWATNNPDGGSTFRFTLPAVQRVFEPVTTLVDDVETADLLAARIRPRAATLR